MVVVHVGEAHVYLVEALEHYDQMGSRFVYVDTRRDEEFAAVSLVCGSYSLTYIVTGVS